MSGVSEALLLKITIKRGSDIGDGDVKSKQMQQQKVEIMATGKTESEHDELDDGAAIEQLASDDRFAEIEVEGSHMQNQLLLARLRCVLYDFLRQDTPNNCTWV